MNNLALKSYVFVATFAATNFAQAQQDLGSRITEEDGLIDQITAIGALVLAAAFLAGVGCVSYGIWYYIKKSDNPQEPDAGSKALKFILGGAALTIVPLFIGIFAMTLGGDADSVNTANDQLDGFSQ